MTPDFLLHLNELTLLIQRAGPDGAVIKPTTTFEPLTSIPDTVEDPGDYRTGYRERFLERAASRLVDVLNRS